MRLEIVTAPAVEPVLLDEIKDEIRLETNLDDATIGRYLTTSTGLMDGPTGMLGRALITQDWRLTLDRFVTPIEIPLPPLQSITTIKYDPPTGAEVTMPAADYRVFETDDGASIRPAVGGSWPAILDAPDAVRVVFKAGYGDSWNDVPEAIRSAMLILAGNMYEGHEVDKSFVKDLITDYRIFAF